jgi:hypothetical protein
MFDVINLNDDYGYNDFRISAIESTVIDASNASWMLANFGDKLSRYPVFIDNSSNVTLVGGTILGNVPLDVDWRDAYVNSSAITFRNSVGHMVVKDWTITQVWDGVRINGSGDFLIDNVWINITRDDAVENDEGLNGTIKDSLFDDVFVGISLGDENAPDSRGNLVTIDQVLIRMQSYPYKGRVTHGPIFKTVDSVSPQLRIDNSIFAIEDVEHFDQERLAWAWNRTTSASGNYFLNLSDEPLPKDYPLPKTGFTILEGSEARAFWEAARSRWILGHNGRN